MVLGDTVSTLEMYVLWIFNHVSRSMHVTWSLFTLKAPTWSNDYSQHNLSCGGVNLLIG